LTQRGSLKQLAEFGKERATACRHRPIEESSPGGLKVFDAVFGGLHQIYA